MGSRRMGRRRLHSLDKLGKSLTAAEIGIGAGLSPGFVRANQTREGLIVTTEIVLDLGTSAGAIASIDTAANYVIGVSGASAELCDTNDATLWGRIVEVEMVCFEDLATGDDDVILAHHSAKLNGLANGAAATRTAVDQTDWNAGVSDAEYINAAPGRYWFLLSGGNDTAGTYSTGKMVIRFTGQADPAGTTDL